MIESIYIKFCKRFGKMFRSTASDELKEAVSILGWNISAGDIVGAGKALMLLFVTFMAVIAVLSVFFPINPLMLVMLVPCGILLFFLMTEWPKVLARERALAALGQSPHLIAQIAIPLKQKPNLELALAFVSENSEGIIANDLRNLVWSSLSGKVTNLLDGFRCVADRWGKWSTGFQRSINLIIASFHEANRKHKQALLDTAISSILDDIVAKTKEYMEALNMPTMLLFSLGMVLPLMVVTLFPLVSLFGFQSGPSVLAIMLAVSLIGSYIYSNHILRKRPPTFSRPALLPSKNIRIGSQTFAALPFSIVIGVIISIPGIFYLLGEGGILLQGPLLAISNIGTVIILWAFAAAIATYCYCTVQDAAKIRARTVALEECFVDGLVYVHNKLRDGKPLEDSIDFAASLSVGETSDLFKSIAMKMRSTSLPFEKIVSEMNTPSALVKNTLTMLSASVRYGLKATAQTTSVVVAYLKRMKDAERALALMLKNSLSMMRATAIAFAPVVCAVIVVLFQMITKTIQQTQQASQNEFTLLQTSVSPELLQLIVGVYSLGLNFILLRYINMMQHGSDTIPLRMDIAKAMPMAMLLFTITLIAVRMSLASAI